MAIDAGTVELTAVPNISQFGSLLSGGVTKQLGPVEDLLRNNLGKAVTAGVGVALFELGKISVEAFQEHEDVLIKFQNTLSNMPALAHASIKPFEEQATALQNLTGVEDEQILAADEVLGRFGLTADQLRELTPLVLDYAAKTGQDAATAATNLGRALLGNTRALKAIGVTYKATGDRTTDYNNIVEQLQTHVGGLAEQFGETLPGQINILKAQINDVAEVFGGILVPVLSNLAHFLITVLGPALAFLSDHAKQVTTAILGFVAFKGVVIVVELLSTALVALGGSFATAGTAVGLFGLELQAAMPWFAAAAAAGYALGKALAASSEAFVAGTEEMSNAAAGLALNLDHTEKSAQNFQVTMGIVANIAERSGANLEPATAAFEGLTDAFSAGNISAKEYGIGLKRLGFNSHQVAGFIGLARKESENLKVALDDTNPSIRDLARSEGDLSDEAKKAADATIKLWEAELQLAGGIEAVVVDQRNQVQAEADLAKARRHLAGLEAKGITSGKKYNEAQQAVADATDASFQAHLALANAVDSVIQEQIDNGKTMNQSIGYFEKLARQSGFTNREIRESVRTFREETNNVSQLNDQLDNIPKHAETTYSLKFDTSTERHLKQLGGFNLSPGAGSGFGTVRGHAEGGWVMHPEIAAVAEKEPELIIPKSKLEKAYAFAGDHEVHVTVGVDRSGNLRAYVDDRINAERGFQERRSRMER